MRFIDEQVLSSREISEVIELMPVDDRKRKRLIAIRQEVRRIREFCDDRDALAKGSSLSGVDSSFTDVKARLIETHKERLIVDDEGLLHTARVEMSSARLFSLLNNLVADAVLHSGQETIVTLKVQADKKDRQLVITVSDKGRGIPEEYFGRKA
jgi:signal transduction histidine kinase